VQFTQENLRERRGNSSFACGRWRSRNISTDFVFYKKNASYEWTITKLKVHFLVVNLTTTTRELIFLDENIFKL
jgi:hypothetical protein